MLLPDETAQTTEALAPLSRTLEHRSAPNGRQQHILPQKQTDVLPPLDFDTPHARVARRQATQLRAENRHLYSVIEQRNAQLQQLLDEYNQLKTQFDNEVTIIHNGHQQEIEQIQQQLQELLAERNRLHDTHLELECRYQRLLDSFQENVTAEAHKLMTQAAEQAIQSPDIASPLLQDVVKVVETHLRQEENKHLAEIFYLKREVQRMAELLLQERQQINAERQQLIAWQGRLREQADLRQETLQQRYHVRWRIVSLSTSLGLLTLLVVLQLSCLAFFHVPFITPVSLALLSPIIICILLALLLATPFNLLKYMYESAPRRVKVKK